MIKQTFQLLGQISYLLLCQKEVWYISQHDAMLYTCVQLSLTLGDPMDCSLPGSSAHGIFQARIREWVAISYFMGYSQSRDRTYISCLAGRFFTTEPCGDPKGRQRELQILSYKLDMSGLPQEASGSKHPHAWAISTECTAQTAWFCSRVPPLSNSLTL